MQKALVLFASAILLFACTEEIAPVADPCDCVDIINNHAKDHPTFDSCLHKMQYDAKFSIAFKKCQYAKITGQDTSNVQIPERKKEELQLPQDGRYELDLAASEIRFIGKNSLMGKKHIGLFKFSEGHITLQDTAIYNAEFMIDMNSLSGKDFEEKESQQNFERHLKDSDFFDVAKHPTATIKLISSNERIYRVKTQSEVTIKGTTKKLELNVTLGTSGNDELKASGSMILNRTDFGINYGSGSIFENLGDNIIDDNVPIVYELTLKRVE